MRNLERNTPWIPKTISIRRARKIRERTPKTKKHLRISFFRMMVLILLGVSVLVLSCISAFMVGSRTIPGQNGWPLGLTIGGMLCLFFKVLYGSPRVEIQARKCGKCRSELHAGFLYCGVCGCKQSNGNIR